MAVLAALYYRFPANKMMVVAITGSKGKTTTCNMLHKIFTEAGLKTGMLTTVNFKIGEFEEANLQKQSTLSPFLLQRKIREMASARCKVLVLEVTSHSIIQSRIWGINIDTAVFTNLENEHLDYHGTFDDYMQTKGRLFSVLNTSARKPDLQKCSVVNMDDPTGSYFSAFPADQVFEYGIQKGTYVARNLVSEPGGTKFLLKIPNGEAQLLLKIPGRINVYNALAAATAATAMHVPLNIIKSALEKMQPIQGRLEVIDEGQPFTVVVDYAHTEKSLEALLGLFRELTKGKLILVFGATGDRDRIKRPKMGEIAHRFADTIILTNDDPYTESPEGIAAEVRAGIPRTEGNGFWQILDRREAIRLALSLAGPGDSVLLAGKGAEEFQVVGHQKIPHDDRVVARECLARAATVTLN
jgi:UDP-N-acetylmuramoyl-L-alanyl-D-glutamate--2,6-diaminopimelate ligase